MFFQEDNTLFFSVKKEKKLLIGPKQVFLSLPVERENDRL